MLDIFDNDVVDDVVFVVEVDIVIGIWIGGDFYNFDKDYGDEVKKLKVNRDSIGVLLKFIGKLKKVVVF